jgi:hypothetical protein
MLEHKEIQDKLLIYDVFGGELHYLSEIISSIVSFSTMFQ